MKVRREDTVETPVASLIDVVFLLIIFFVVTASVEKEVIDESIRLAQAKFVQAATQKNPLTVTINVAEDGSLNIAKMPVSIQKLRQILRATRRDAGENVPMLIRADANSRYEHVAKVQEIIQESGFYKVKLAAIATD